jgi:hypothetical protein
MSVQGIAQHNSSFLYVIFMLKADAHSRLIRSGLICTLTYPKAARSRPILPPTMPTSSTNPTQTTEPGVS